MKSDEAFFVGIVFSKCERLIAQFRDDLPGEVYDALVEMHDRAKKIAERYYDNKGTPAPAPDEEKNA